MTLFVDCLECAHGVALTRRRKREQTMTITNTNIRTLRTEAAAAGDIDMVRICDKAICGDVKAIAECYRVMLDCDEEDARGWN